MPIKAIVKAHFTLLEKREKDPGISLPQNIKNLPERVEDDQTCLMSPFFPFSRIFKIFLAAPVKGTDLASSMPKKDLAFG